MALFSTNCREYYDVVTAAVHGEAVVPGSDERCRVRFPSIATCHKKELENPDSPTDTMAREQALLLLREKGCPNIPDDVSKLEMRYKITQYSNPHQESSPQTLEDANRVSNCLAAGVDRDDVNSVITATCHPTQPMTDVRTGKSVTSYRMRTTSQLGVCDLRPEAEPQVLEDARKVAAFNLEKNRNYKIHPKDLDCTFSFIPGIL